MTAEKYEAYSAIINCMLEYSPLQTREEITIKYSDDATSTIVLQKIIFLSRPILILQ